MKGDWLTMTKREKLESLLKPYLEANIVTEIPNQVKMGIDNVLGQAEDYDLYDEYIEIAKNNPISEDDPEKSYYDLREKTIKYVPPLEIVDVDVDVYEEEEDDDEEGENFGDYEYEGD